MIRIAIVCFIIFSMMTLVLIQHPLDYRMIGIGALALAAIWVTIKPIQIGKKK